MMSMVGDIKTCKSRKRHRCVWCGGVIEQGAEYCNWAWEDGGRLSTVKVHTECNAAWATEPDVEIYIAGTFARGCTCESGDCTCDKGR